VVQKKSGLTEAGFAILQGWRKQIPRPLQLAALGGLL
jgi:hypothetical protein